MTKRELIKRLETFSDDTVVMVLDGFNAQGNPRTLNFGPVEHVVTAAEAEETADCEDLIGEPVALIGYGCY